MAGKQSIAWPPPSPAGATARFRNDVMARLRRAFRREFPNDTVDISDGFEGNIHVVVVSRRFDKLSSRQMHTLMWRIIDGAGLTKDEQAMISLVHPVSVAEIK